MSVAEYPEVHVVGSGPGEPQFRLALAKGEVNPASLVIAINEVAWRLGASEIDKVETMIHFTADYGYAKTVTGRAGMLPVVARIGGDHPVPPPSRNWLFWVATLSDDAKDTTWPSPVQSGLRISIGWNGGFAAWCLADQVGADHVHLWGLDGGGPYEKFRPMLEEAARQARAPFTDHAGRLHAPE